MKHYAVIVLVLIAVLFIFGCSMSSLTTTTTNEYDDQGKLVKTTIVENKEGWLRNKTVGVKDDGYSVSFTTAVDPTTGMIMPTMKTSSGSTSVTTVPSVPFGDMDMKSDSTITAKQSDSFCNNTESFYFEKSIWSDKAAKIKYERIGSGYNLPDPSVKINMISVIDGEPKSTDTPSMPEPPKPPAIPGAQ